MLCKLESTLVPHPPSTVDIRVNTFSICIVFCQSMWDLHRLCENWIWSPSDQPLSCYGSQEAGGIFMCQLSASHSRMIIIMMYPACRYKRYKHFFLILDFIDASCARARSKVELDECRTGWTCLLHVELDERLSSARGDPVALVRWRWSILHTSCRMGTRSIQTECHEPTYTVCADLAEKRWNVSKTLIKISFVKINYTIFIIFVNYLDEWFNLWSWNRNFNFPATPCAKNRTITKIGDGAVRNGVPWWSDVLHRHNTPTRESSTSCSSVCSDVQIQQIWVNQADTMLQYKPENASAHELGWNCRCCEHSIYLGAKGWDMWRQPNTSIESVHVLRSVIF